MANNDREVFLKQIEVLEAQFAEEERLNPTPKNIVQLSQLAEMLQSDDWERSNYDHFHIYDIFDKARYETDPFTGETYRFFEGYVNQYHKHKINGFEIKRSFKFHHKEGKLESLEIEPDTITWDADQLIIKNGDRIIFNGYMGDSYGSDTYLDLLLESILTPQIEEAFKLSIDTSILYMPVYTYVDDGIKTGQEMIQQWLNAGDNTLNNTIKGIYIIKKVQAVYAGIDSKDETHFAFVGKRLAHSPQGKGDCELYLTYGGCLVWLEDGKIFFTKDPDELPVEFSEGVLNRINTSMSELYGLNIPRTAI